MTRTLSLALLALGLFSMLAPGCGGGSGAALRYTMFPGDRMVNGRRLESLARTFENSYGCTATDTIQIVGFVSQAYNVDGCGTTSDYMLSCRPGGYSGQICEWQELASLAQQAASDFRCDAASIDQQVSQSPQRLVTGCGYQAMYQFNGQAWMLYGRIEQVGPPTGAVVQGSGTAYVQ